MEPISMGAIVAALIAKALDRAEDGVVDDALAVARNAVAGLRRLFAGDAEAEEAIDGLVDNPDSDRRTEALSRLLDERAEDSPELLGELRKIVGEAEAAGMRIGPTEQVAEGDGNVQIISQGSQVSVQTPGPRKPRD
jgi:hypothetical protein